MPARATMTMRIVRPFMRVNDRLGIAPYLPWTQSGFDAGEPIPDTRLPHDLVDGLLRASVEAAGRPDYGLLAAEEVRRGELDVFELAVRARATVRDALACAQRLYPLLHDGVTLSVHDDGGSTEVCVSLAPGLELHPAGHEFVLGVTMIGIRRATENPNLRAEAVLLPAAATGVTDTHTRVFGCTPRFGQARTALRLSAAAMALPLADASPVAAPALERLATELLEVGHTPEDFRADVIRAISQELATGRVCTAESVAKLLGVTPRTLQRRLRDAGESFRDLRAEHRMRLARSYLERPDLTLSEIAFLLGFTTPQAFHRAFRRASAQSPMTYRHATQSFR